MDFPARRNAFGPDSGLNAPYTSRYLAKPAMPTQSAVRKNPFISPRVVAPLAAIGLLVGLFCAYYFVHITRHERSIDDRAFHTLAAIGFQFKDQINNRATVFHGIAEKVGGAYEARVTNSNGQRNSNEVDSTASRKVTDNVGQTHKGLPGAKGKAPVGSNNPIRAGKKGANESGTSLEVPTFVAVQGSRVASIDDCSSSPNIGLLQKLRPNILTANVVPDSGGSAVELSYKHVCTRFTIEASLSSFINTKIFDDIVLTDDSMRVLYQTERSGVVADTLSFSFAQAPSKGSPTEAAASTQPASELPLGGKELASLEMGDASNVFTIRLAGATYRAYVVPVRLPIPRLSGIGVSSGARFVLCGLVLQDHFTEEGRSAPLTALLGFFLGAIFVLASAWPTLKFATMQRSEQIPRWAGLFYSVTVVFAVLVMTVLVIHLYYGFSDPKTDSNMKDVAHSIDEHVGKEIKRALLVMRSVGTSPTVKRQALPVHEPIPCDETPENKATPATLDLLRNAGMEVSDYPYFRRLFVYDNLGFERYLWTVDSQLPNPLRSCDRPYFQGVQRNDLWYLTEEGLPGTPFRVDPIYSKTTGEYLAGIARPYKIQPEKGPAIDGVMAMFTPMMSLINPVLPPDYGFAVIDPSGGVLFHSDSSKNGRENVFDQLQDSRALRAAVTARRPTGRGFTAQYLDDDYSLFATPLQSIQGCPWTLIVFTNRAILGDKALERSLLFALLCLTYLIVFGITVGLLASLRAGREIVWPDENKVGCYCHLALVLVAVSVLTFALFFQVNTRDLIWFAIAIPISAVAVSILKIGGREMECFWRAALPGALALSAAAVEKLRHSNSSDELPYLTLGLICMAYSSLGIKRFIEWFEIWTARQSLPTAYSFAAVALLAVVAGIPCIAFFKLSYDYDEGLAARRQQLLTISALNSREKRVIDQYFQVRISGEQSSFSEDLGKWLFLRRRLEEQLDRYDNVFRGQTEGQILVPYDVPKWPGWLVSLEESFLWHRPESLTPAVTEDCTPGAIWRWREEGANRIRIQRDQPPETNSAPCSEQEANLKPATSSPETLALRKLATRDPIFLAQDLTSHIDVLRASAFAGETGVVFLLLGLLVFISVRSSVTRMFLLRGDFSRRRVWKEIAFSSVKTLDTNGILVDHPQSDKLQWLEENGANVGVCDVATERKSYVPTFGEKIVVLDHFEYGMSDSSVMQWKLKLLEELLHDRTFLGQRRIIIITTVDPLFYLEELAHQKRDDQESTVDASGMERWRLVLAQFETFRVSGSSQCASKFCYQVFWSSSTWLERIALHSLATNGWPNCKNLAALNHLWTRGLVTSNTLQYPRYRLADPEFGKYISGQVSGRDRHAWHQHEASGITTGLPSAFLLLIVGILAAVLYLSHQDIFGIVTGMIGALTAATKVISDLRSTRPRSSAGGSEAA